LSEIDKDIFLSDAAQEAFVDPFATMRQLEEMDPRVIEKAYALRKEDLTLDECTKALQALL
jgi:hypothetical protein